MSNLQFTNAPTVFVYRHREAILCPSCTQHAVLPITEPGAEYDDTEHVLDVVAREGGHDRAAITSDILPAPIPSVEILNQVCSECAQTLLPGKYWDHYHAVLAAIAAQADTVETLIELLNGHYRPQSGVAFHPGGADRDLWHVLRWERNDWTTVWSKANYWYAMRDSQGNTFTYTEGDLERGPRP